MRAIILVCLFPRVNRAMLPIEGAINGSQKRRISMSGFAFLRRSPNLSHVNGLMELNVLWIFRFIGAGRSENCDLPGKSNSGYWVVKVFISTV
jgi:hypothetical protein